MNTFLIIYLCILLFEAVLSTILKYAWQAENQWDEPFYNQKTEQEKNSSPVRLPPSGPSGMMIPLRSDASLDHREVFHYLALRVLMSSCQMIGIL